MASRAYQDRGAIVIWWDEFEATQYTPTIFLACSLPARFRTTMEIARKRIRISVLGTASRCGASGLQLLPSLMSALGQKRTCGAKRHVRFTPESGYVQRT